MFDLLQQAVDSAIASGAKYSDARILSSKSRSIQARNGDIEDFNESESVGIGIRALVGSSWGFYSTYDLSNKSLINSGIKAYNIAKASAKVPGKEFPLADVPIVQDQYTTPHEKNPFEISPSDQINLITKSTEEMKEH